AIVLLLTRTLPLCTLLLDRLHDVYWARQATTETFPLSLHDALPICNGDYRQRYQPYYSRWSRGWIYGDSSEAEGYRYLYYEQERSEEHTSELQSRFDLVCRLLLEKKNTEKAKRRR